jgi:hypothetical protein
MKTKHKFSVIVCAIFLLLPFTFYLLPCAKAHTFHTTLTRIDYNEKEKLAEISIQIFTHDLSPTLETVTKKRVDFEKTKDVNF